MEWGELLKLGGAALGYAKVAGAKFIGFGVAHPKALMVGSVAVPFAGYAGWQRVVNGQGFDSSLAHFMSPKLGDAYDKKSLIGAVKYVAGGEDAVDKGATKTMADETFGEGTTDKVSNEVGKLYDQTKDIAGDVVDGTGDALRAGRDAVADAYNGARGMMSGFVTGPDGQQQYIPPTGAEDYQRQAMMQYYQTQQYQQQYANSGDGLFGGLNMFSGIGNMMGSIFSGGKGLSLAAIIPAAMLMFGNFGWFGKIASLMLGSLAYKNMTNQRMLQLQPAYQQVVPQVQQQVVPQPQVQQGYSPQLVLTPGQGHQSLSEQLALSDQDNNVVKRSRA